MTTARPSSASAGTNAHGVGVYGAAGTLLGILLSGPVAVTLVNATHPQPPPWQDAVAFASSYHAVQLLTYVGAIVLVAALAMRCWRHHPPRASKASQKRFSSMISRYCPQDRARPACKRS